MAPIFDSNMALISRGYADATASANGILIDMFLEVIREKGISYHMPSQSDVDLRNILESDLLNENTDRAYVVTVVTEHWERIVIKLKSISRHLQGHGSVFAKSYVR